MALKALSSIDNLSDMLDYVGAEFTEAKKYCSAAVTAYTEVLTDAKSFYDADKSIGYDSTKLSYALSTITSGLTSARNVWKAAGCTKTTKSGKTLTEPGDEKDASSLMPILLTGAGLLAVWYFTKKR
jgi:hypothetical protein